MTKQEKVIQIAENKLAKLDEIVLQLYESNLCQKKNKDLLLGDIVDLRTYYAAIVNEDFKTARRIQENVDTCVRESISQSCYDFVYFYFHKI